MQKEEGRKEEACTFWKVLFAESQFAISQGSTFLASQ